MSESLHHPVEPSLHRYRPHRAIGVVEAGDDPAADALLARVLASTPAHRPQRPTSRSRSWRGAIGVAAVVLGGATAAAAYIATREPTDRSVISCWSTPDLGTNDQVGLPGSSSVTATEQCARLWTDGTFGTGEVPVLTECVTDGGVIAVVPGLTGGCGAIGLSLPATPDTGPVDPSADLTAAISERFAGTCHDLDAATADIRDILDELGLPGWTIAPPPTTETTESCIFAAVDTSSNTIRLTVVPRP